MVTMVGHGSELTDSERLTVDMLRTDRHVSSQEARIWALTLAWFREPPGTQSRILTAAMKH